MSDLFVSYKAEDRARVASLVQALETDGLSVWWDEHIGGGDEWRDTILRHLEAARCVIVVWSKRSVGPHGSFVRDEATRALRRGTYLPVRIDKVEPPLGFGETQALELHGWKGDRGDQRYQAVLSCVRNRLGIPPADANSRSHAAPTSRRGVLIGAGAAGAVAIAGGGAWFFTSKDDSHGDSIAVLPFANLSGDPNQAYFSDGIAEELRNALSRIAGLHVVARTSSEAVRDDDARTAAHKLGVDNILTGSVRRSPEMIRVSAQLIDGRQGLEKWSEDFDRPRGDALQIQTDIASRVADALKIRLGESGIRALTEGGTRIAAAQDLLLKARDLVARTDTPDAQQHALGLVDSAIALDPGYANAYSAKASLMLDSGGTNGAAVEPTARRAVALAPGSAEAHRTLAFILFLELKLRQAFAQLETAASLPGGLRGEFDNGYGFIWMLADFGRPEALARADEMIAGDPLNAASYHAKGYVLYTRRRYAEADRQFLKAIEIAPQLAGGHAFHGLMLMELGKLDEADAVLSKLPAYYYMAPVLRAVIAARRGDHALSDRFLAALRSQYGDRMSCQYADIYAQQGLKDQALAELENAWKTRDPGLAAIKTDTLYDPLRSDPRFQTLVNKLDFPT